MAIFTGALTYIVLKSSIWKDQCTILTIKFENGMLFANLFLANGLATTVQIKASCYTFHLEQRRQYEIPCDKMQTCGTMAKQVCVFFFKIGLPK